MSRCIYFDVFDERKHYADHDAHDRCVLIPDGCASDMMVSCHNYSRQRQNDYRPYWGMFALMENKPLPRRIAKRFIENSSYVMFIIESDKIHHITSAEDTVESIKLNANADPLPRPSIYMSWGYSSTMGPCGCTGCVFPRTATVKRDGESRLQLSTSAAKNSCLPCICLQKSRLMQEPWMRFFHQYSCPCVRVFQWKHPSAYEGNRHVICCAWRAMLKSAPLYRKAFKTSRGRPQLKSKNNSQKNSFSSFGPDQNLKSLHKQTVFYATSFLFLAPTQVDKDYEQTLFLCWLC